MNNTRDVGVSVSVQKVVDVEEIAVREELVYVNHMISEKEILVRTAFYNSENSILKYENTNISGENYDLLMSDDKNVFGEDKKRESFQGRDIWLILDRIRNHEV